MHYFNEVSLESEELLSEIIQLKATNTGTGEYWNNRFDPLNGQDDAILRILFKELRESELITTQWGDDIPYNLNLTNNGVNYFTHKQNYEIQLERNRRPMGFEELDHESEELLLELTQPNISFPQFLTLENCEVWDNLFDCKYLKGKTKAFINGEKLVSLMGLEQKGKSYFEMKEKHEKNMERTRPVLNYINTGDYSPVNSVIGNSNNTTQTVDYANNDQLKALEEFVVQLNTSTELSPEQKEEILEMIESIKETSESGGKIKGFFIAIKTLLSGTTTLSDQWKSVKSRFGIGD